MTENERQVHEVLRKLMQNQKTLNDKLVDIQDTLRNIQKKADTNNDIRNDLSDIEILIKQILNKVSN